jgi:hypothetical protein
LVLVVLVVLVAQVQQAAGLTAIMVALLDLELCFLLEADWVSWAELLTQMLAMVISHRLRLL